MISLALIFGIVSGVFYFMDKMENKRRTDCKKEGNTWIQGYKFGSGMCVEKGAEKDIVK